MAYKYLVAENWGKGFITAKEYSNIEFIGFPGNIWRIPANNEAADLWVVKVSGSIITKTEAQTIINAQIETAQANWDSLPEERKTNYTVPDRPSNIVLE
jgi:hypothetical protein